MDQNNIDRPVILLQTKVSSPLYLLLPGPAQELAFQAEPAAESRPVWVPLTYQKLWAVSINDGKSLSWLAQVRNGFGVFRPKVPVVCYYQFIALKGERGLAEGVFVEHKQASMHPHNSSHSVPGWNPSGFPEHDVTVLYLSFTEVWTYW